MQIIPIASGKGGVGKSLLSANLAIALGQAGKNVLIADLDLGASNREVLHLRIRSYKQDIRMYALFRATPKFPALQP